MTRRGRLVRRFRSDFVWHWYHLLNPAVAARRLYDPALSILTSRPYHIDE